jgi:purine-binding chemotaxis protein CheW
MMAMQSYLMFMLHGTRYAIAADAVLEIFLLPELTPIAEAPSYVAGLLNLRGTILPAIDLDARLGRAPHRPRTSDGVIVVRVGAATFGLIVEEVREVREIEEGAIGPVPPYGGGEGNYEERFITAIARVGDAIIPVLGLDRVAGLADDIGRSGLPDDEGLFAPEADAEAREVLRDRARSLLAPIDREARAGAHQVALFALGGEYFAMSLALVREFAEIHDVTPVPCCPPHIVGQTNLRGDILTLVDIRGALRMGTARNGGHGRTIVIQIDDIRAGIIADEVIDVTDLLPGEISPPPVALRSGGKTYVTGVATLGGKIFSMLDVAGIFRGGGLVVDEQVG